MDGKGHVGWARVNARRDPTDGMRKFCLEEAAMRMSQASAIARVMRRGACGASMPPGPRVVTRVVQNRGVGLAPSSAARAVVGPQARTAYHGVHGAGVGIRSPARVARLVRCGRFRVAWCTAQKSYPMPGSTRPPSSSAAEPDNCPLTVVLYNKCARKDLEFGAG